MVGVNTPALANEMAPRVHNSGHWTIEGAETSQFENHLRAILGLPLGSTRALGHAAMLVNEGLPGFIVKRLQEKHDLRKEVVGILGMAFKADVDDIRDSLSYKLAKLLRFHGSEVLCTDEFAKDPAFVTKEELVARSSIVIVGVPHTAYRTLSIPAGTQVFDVWGLFK